MKKQTIYQLILTVFFCINFVVVSVFISIGAHAQDINIAVVDVDKILNTSKAGISLQTQLSARRESFQKEFSALEDNLSNLQKSLMDQKQALNNEEFASKRDSYEKQLMETRSLFQKRRNSLDKGLGDALSELRKNIIQITADVADEKGFKVVLTRDSVVIVEKNMDITDIVLERLDNSVSSISLSVE